VDVPTFVRVFVQLFVAALFFVLIARILISWINPQFEGPVARFLHDTTEPLLAPIRRVLPQTGMVDLSPMILGMVLLILMRVLLLR
jgi:YggT family protein